MKKQIKPYIFYMGLVTVVIGIVLAIFFTEVDGAMKSLPFVLIGVGSGITGVGMLSFFRARLEKKNPDILKQLDIEEKDERNIRLREKAGYATWFVTQFVLVALLLTLVILDYGVARWLTLSALFIHNISLFIFMGINNNKI